MTESTVGETAPSSGPAKGLTTAIVNPRSANGRTARAWATIRRQLESAIGPLQVLETAAPQHATALAASAIRGGSKTIIAVGGDGTVHEVVNGFFDREGLVSRDTVLGIIPQGTGSDFRRTLSLPLNAKAAIEVIRQGAVKRIDAGRVRFQTLEGTSNERYCINVTSFGVGGAVARRANQSSKLLGGKLTFALATALTVRWFQGNTVTLHLDGKALPETKITHVAVGNGQYHGGGMWVCPRAVPDDGLLDVTVIRHLSALQILRASPALYNGRLYEHPSVEYYRASRVNAFCSDESLIEIDGEPAGRLPLEISVLPKAMAVYVPGGETL